MRHKEARSQKQWWSIIFYAFPSDYFTHCKLFLPDRILEAT